MTQSGAQLLIHWPKRRVGVHALYQALEKTRTLRILTGISTNKATLEFIEQARQTELQFFHAESAAHTAGPREVILSEYLIGEAEQ